MKKRIIIIPAVIIVIVLAAVITGRVIISSMEKNLEYLVVQEVPEVDFSQIPDGTYHGSKNAFPIVVEIEAVAESGRVTDIKLLKHRNGQGGAADAVPAMVLEKQGLDIDAVSGATYSRKVILLTIAETLIAAKN